MKRVLLALAAACLPVTAQAATAQFEQTAPLNVTYEEGTDFAVLIGSALTDVTGPLGTVTYLSGFSDDCTLGSGDLTGRIAIYERGTCLFSSVTTYVQDQGGLGLLIYGSELNPLPATGTLQPELFGPFTITALSISRDLGLSLLDTPGAEVRVALAADVPLPASGLLLMGALGWMARPRRRA